jgi:hypothetical protein
MKHTFILAAIIAICHSVHAQDQVRFGLKAGVNSSTINSSVGSVAVTSIYSFYAGGIAVFPVSKSFSVQSELIYSQEGADLDNLNLELNYIRLPLLFQYHHTSGFHVEAGPQIGIVVKGKVLDETTKEDMEAGNQLSKAGTSFAIGFGYRMKNGLGIDFRYAKGIDSPISGTNARLVNTSGGLSFVF